MPSRARRPELHDARPRRQGHRPGPLRRGLPRRRHAVLQAAAQPDAALPHPSPSTPRRRWPCPACKAVLTADDLPAVTGRPRAACRRSARSPTSRSTRASRCWRWPRWTKDRRRGHRGVAVDVEPLPFVVDPIASLRPGRRQRPLAGQRVRRRQARHREVAGRRLSPRPATARCRWATAAPGGSTATSTPASAPPRWCSTRPSTPTPPATSRSRRARRWPTGRTASSTCTARRRAWRRRWRSVARWVGVDAAQVVIVSEYTGGGFGSKIPGAHSMAIPALLAKKAGAPVMMRITREEEHYIGRTRPNLIGRVKVGLRARTAGSPPSISSSCRTPGRTRISTTSSRRPASARSPTSRWRCASAASRC